MKRVQLWLSVSGVHSRNLIPDRSLAVSETFRPIRVFGLDPLCPFAPSSPPTTPLAVCLCESVCAVLIKFRHLSLCSGGKHSKAAWPNRTSLSWSPLFRTPLPKFQELCDALLVSFVFVFNFCSGLVFCGFFHAPSTGSIRQRVDGFWPLWVGELVNLLHICFGAGHCLPPHLGPKTR